MLWIRTIIGFLMAVVLSTAITVHAQHTTSHHTGNILLVGWDGVQRNHLKDLIAAGSVPNLVALTNNGNLVAIDMVRKTNTKPGWKKILTGYQAEMTGVYDNSRFRPIPSGYTILERMEMFLGDGIFTASLFGKGEQTGARPPDPTAKRPFPGGPFFLTQSGIDLFENALWKQVGPRALEVLDEHGQERFFMLVHFAQPDGSGHKFGENSVEYTNDIISNDVNLGLLLDKLNELGVRDNTLVYVTSDHGFDEGKNPTTMRRLCFWLPMTHWLYAAACGRMWQQRCFGV